jgi:hypothetical protein
VFIPVKAAVVACGKYRGGLDELLSILNFKENMSSGSVVG